MTKLNELTKKLKEDKDFAEKIAKITSKEELLSELKEAGFDFSEQKQEASAQVAGKELSDDAMEGVAGGFTLGGFEDGERTETCELCGGKVFLRELGCPRCGTGIYKDLSIRCYLN